MAWRSRIARNCRRFAGSRSPFELSSRLLVGFVIVLVLGFLTTVHYDRAISRSPEFSGEGFTTWLEYGFRSLLPMAV